MSINYSAKILVGLPFKEVFDSIDEFYNFDYGKHKCTDFEVAFPYYDADYEDCLVGISLVSTSMYQYKEIANTITTECVRKLFKELTGKEAKVYLTVHGS